MENQARHRITKTVVSQAKPTGREYVIRDTEIQGFGLRVRPSGAKSFIHRFRRNGLSKKVFDETFRGFKFMGGGPVVGNVSIGMPVNWDDLYPVSGGYGNPTLGSGEIGRQMFDRLVKDLSEIVAAFRAMDVHVKAPARV